MTEFIEGIFRGVFVLLPLWVLGLLILAGLLSVISDWVKRLRGKE